MQYGCKTSVTPQIPRVIFFFLATRQVYRNREIFVAIEFLCRTHVLIMYAPRPGPVRA